MTDLEEMPDTPGLDFWVINYEGDCVRVDERTCKNVADMMDLGVSKGMWVTDIYGGEQWVVFSEVISLWHVNQRIREAIAAHNKLLEDTSPSAKKFD